MAAARGPKNPQETAPDGSWARPASKAKHQAIHYNLIETWKQFRFLVDMYGFSKEDASAARAAEHLFSCQTTDGDIRGMLANQYANYYTGAILALLIKAGYEDDPRVEKGFQWLLSMRQDDLGWSESLITHDLDRETIYRLFGIHGGRRHHRILAATDGGHVIIDAL